MLLKNIGFDEMRVVADKILQKNLIPQVVEADTNLCDMCGQQASTLYYYYDGYNHQRWICGCCGLVNIPFTGNKFRINNLSKGFLVLEPSRANITVITNSINTKNASNKQISDIDWIEFKGDMYSSLLDAIKQSNKLGKKRYIIQLGKRMHNYMHLAQASYGEHLHITTEESVLNLNMDLVQRIISDNGNDIDMVISKLVENNGYINNQTLDAYKSIIKKIVDEQKV